MPVKPTEQEEEYFARLEFDRRREALRQRDSEAADQERERILAVAQGRCPRCAALLVAITFREIELDKCSRCQGVWLDCGELEQLAVEEGGFLGSVRRIFG